MCIVGSVLSKSVKTDITKERALALIDETVGRKAKSRSWVNIGQNDSGPVWAVKLGVYAQNKV